MSRKIGTAGLIVSALLFWACPKNGIVSGHDEIRLASTASSAKAGVLLDGRRDACVEDELHQTAGKVLIPNVLADDSSCKSRLAVFAQDNAFHYSTPTWTDKPKDVLNVVMSSPERMRLAVWMVAGEVGDAEMDVINAKQLYNGMNGIDFDPATVTDVTTDPKAPGLAKASCADVAKLQGIGFTPGHLNVYYVKEITETDSPRGKVCSGSPAIVLVKLEAPIEVSPMRLVTF